MFNEVEWGEKQRDRERYMEKNESRWIKNNLGFCSRELYSLR